MARSNGTHRGFTANRRTVKSQALTRSHHFTPQEPRGPLGSTPSMALQRPLVS